ncbi:MAG: polysaccharide deacetylase family protein [Longimicrobiales bacterium]
MTTPRSCALTFHGLFALILASCADGGDVGSTEAAKWQDAKRGAISITFDDGSPNQFRNAMPILNRLGMHATFFIVTGEIEGSEHPPAFLGRPFEEIMRDVAAAPTDATTFLERASALAYLGYEGTRDAHVRAGSLYEGGDVEEAYALIDRTYASVAAGDLQPGRDIGAEARESASQPWDDYRRFAAQGHEFGSHTITHPRLAALDETNLLYELEGSKEDIRKRLGDRHTFSAEAPFGTENERVMDYLLDLYPATRNRMPHPWLEEINRSNGMAPAGSDKEYVQWQRGPLTAVPVDTMKSWVDTVLANDDIWLVLVFHGVDGIGWEPRTSEDLDVYFRYIKDREDDLWIATFGDVTKYMRQRMNAEVRSERQGDRIIVELTHRLGPELFVEPERYDLDLTLRTRVPRDWARVTMRQAERVEDIQVMTDETGPFVMYRATPNAEPVELSRSGS